ncbi:MAG: ABC transporter permease [Candidatus Hodarchaeota archaeon]
MPNEDETQPEEIQTDILKPSEKEDYTYIPSKPMSELPRSPNQWMSVFRRFRRHKLGMLGTGIFVLIIFCAIFADFIAPYSWDPDITDNGPTPYGGEVISFNGPSDPSIFRFASPSSSAELVQSAHNSPDPIHFAVESDAEVPEDNNHVRFIYALCPFNVLPNLEGLEFDVSLSIDDVQSIGLDEGHFMVQVEVNDIGVGNWTLVDHDAIELSDHLSMGVSNNIRLIFADISRSPVKLVLNWSPITWLEGSTPHQMEVNETILTRTITVGWKYSTTAVLKLSTILELHYGLPPFSVGTRSGRFHLLGTDLIGHDILSGLFYGARISILIGVISMTISCGIGVVVGAVAGYFGGWLDEIIMRLTEIVISIPQFFLLILVLSVFQDAIQGGGTYGAPLLIALIFGVLGWAGISRIVRAEFLSLRGLEYADAARVLGASNWRIMFRHLLPNAMAPIIVIFTMGMAGTILSEAGLSFLGLGNPNTPSWGRMLQLSQEGMRYAWWAAIFPGLAIFVTVLGLNLMGDALRDALDPRLKE